MKRLFYDIEVSPCVGWFWKPSFRTRLNYGNVIEDGKIICISYKWQHEKEAHTLTWSEKDDGQLIRDFVKIMNSADEIVGHNGDRFDAPWIRTRALYHGINNVPRWISFDTLKSARSNLRLPSNRLNDIGQYFGLGEKIHNPPGLWENVCFGDGSRLDEMVRYCEQDVILLQAVFEKIQGVVPVKTHAGVIHGHEKWTCPSCGDHNVKRNGQSVTVTGIKRQRMKCKGCGREYKITGLSYVKFLEWQLKKGPR